MAEAEAGEAQTAPVIGRREAGGRGKQIPGKGRIKARGEAAQAGVGGIGESGQVRMEAGGQLRGVGSGGTCSMEPSAGGDRKGS